MANISETIVGFVYAQDFYSLTTEQRNTYKPYVVFDVSTSEIIVNGESFGFSSKAKEIIEDNELVLVTQMDNLDTSINNVSTRLKNTRTDISTLETTLINYLNTANSSINDLITDVDDLNTSLSEYLEKTKVSKIFETENIQVDAFTYNIIFDPLSDASILLPYVTNTSNYITELTIDLITDSGTLDIKILPHERNRDIRIYTFENFVLDPNEHYKLTAVYNGIDWTIEQNIINTVPYYSPS